MMIARQWNDIAEEEREAWQYKAEQLKQANAAQASLAEMPLLSEAMEEDILREHMPPDPAEQEEHWASKKRASRQPAQKVTNV